MFNSTVAFMMNGDFNYELLDNDSQYISTDMLMLLTGACYAI